MGFTEIGGQHLSSSPFSLSAAVQLLSFAIFEAASLTQTLQIQYDGSVD